MNLYYQKNLYYHFTPRWKEVVTARFPSKKFKDSLYIRV